MVTFHASTIHKSSRKATHESDLSHKDLARTLSKHDIRLNEAEEKKKLLEALTGNKRKGRGL